jgi:exopolyphosphatase/guanosine-5'-triphosphate,3'-diphosphate pyrophosphatase
VTRVGVVDIGTNSTRLLVADDHEPLVRRTEVTGLGVGVDATRRLSDEGIARVHAALATFRGELDRLGAERAVAIATSAVRDAVNGEEFMSGIADRFGFETRILSGDEEAELTRRGVGVRDERTLVLDVGGGSTELIAGSFHVSLDLGSVRSTDRHFHSDPPTPAELEAARREIHALLPELRVDAAIGVAGSVEQLYVLVGDLTVEAVASIVDRLADLPLAERRLVPGLHPERAPAIVAGALIVLEILRRYGLPGLEVSERDLLDGVAGILATATSFW